MALLQAHNLTVRAPPRACYVVLELTDPQSGDKWQCAGRDPYLKHFVSGHTRCSSCAPTSCQL
jgi:hypothetical protein